MPLKIPSNFNFRSWHSPSYSVTKIALQDKMSFFSWFKDGRSQTPLVYCLMFFSDSRYFAICKPTSYRHIRQNVNPRFEIVLSFFIAFFIQIPEYFSYEVNNRLCKLPTNTSRQLEEFLENMNLIRDPIMICFCLKELVFSL